MPREALGLVWVLEEGTPWGLFAKAGWGIRDERWSPDGEITATGENLVFGDLQICRETSEQKSVPRPSPVVPQIHLPCSTLRMLAISNFLVTPIDSQ